MKTLFLAGLLSILLVPHFSYAENHAIHHHASVKHHHRVHARSHSKSSNTQPVDINTADAAELATLKGIGAKKAETILSYREVHGSFQSVDDLAKVKGIGLKTVARLQKNNPGRLVISSKNHKT